MGYLLMLLSAFGMGAAHALEPGHGKTVVAAYLVGSRGRTIDAVLLGGVVTLTHTSSVFLLAVLSTVAAAYLVPNQVQQWLSVSSGVLVTGVGLWMIYARTRYGPPAHSHGRAPAHDLPHDHSHEDHGHSHGHSAAASQAAPAHHHRDAHDHQEVRLRSLVALGVSGGIVPCPAALLLIPAAMGLGAVLKGLVLVVSFSLGLALVLMGIGVITLRTAGFASHWLERGEWTRRLSIASAYFITILGLALTVKALLAPGGLAAH